MRNDNDDNDYAQEEGERKYNKQLERRLINRDPFYPDHYHERDVLSSLVEKSEGKNE